MYCFYFDLSTYGLYNNLTNHLFFRGRNTFITNSGKCNTLTESLYRA